MKIENNISNLAKAIVKTMQEIKSVDKNLDVSTGKGSYKGVADKDVKLEVRDIMANNGLCIIPLKIENDTQHLTKRTTYNGKVNEKPYVFTEVKVTYLLLHESGESIEIQGLGHGEDFMDKASGKATTYALKYALLYLFLIPTGHIDDADTTEPAKENNNQPQKIQSKQIVKTKTTKIKEPMSKPKFSDKRLRNALEKGTAEQIQKTLDIFELTDEQQTALVERLKVLTN